MAYDKELYQQAQIAKHLVGRHDQKKHSRDDHSKTDKIGPAVGALAGGMLGGSAGDISGKGKGLGAALGALLGGLATDQLSRNRPSKDRVAEQARAADREDAILHYWEAADMASAKEWYDLSDEKVAQYQSRARERLKEHGMTEADAKKVILEEWDLSDAQKEDWRQVLGE